MINCNNEKPANEKKKTDGLFDRQKRYFADVCRWRIELEIL